MLENKQKDGETILITGSTGLIGQALVRELTAKSNSPLRLLVRDKAGAKDQIERMLNRGSRNRLHLEQIEFVEGDLTKLSSDDFARLVDGCLSVIHLAGLVHKPDAADDEYSSLNVKVTEQLVSAAAKSKVDTFLFASTIAVYGSGPLEMVEETHALSGNTPYAVSKIECEKIVESSTSIRRAIILRPALVFGEGDKGNLIKLIKAISGRRYVNVGKGNTAKSLIYSGDLAATITLCLQRLMSGKYIFNVANPQPVSMRELSEQISFSLGQKGKLPSIPETLLRSLVGVADSFFTGPMRERIPVSKEQLIKLTTTTTCSVNKLVQMTGFCPKYSLAAALMAEICWAKNSGLLM